jgi:hypothetical protein
VTLVSFVGLFTLPLALLLTWSLIRYSPQRRDAIGLLAGAGGFGLILGIVNLGHRSCGEAGAVMVLSSEGSSSCGGWAPDPFFVIGSVLMAAAVVLYLVAGKRSAERDHRA